VGAALVFAPVLAVTEGDPASVAVTLAYPLADLATLLFVVAAFGVLGWRPGGSWTLLGLGLALFAVADAIYVFQDSTGTYVGGGWLDALWPAGALAMAAAAWQRPDRRGRREDGWAMVVVPATFALGALGVLVVAHLGEVSDLAFALAAAAVLLTLVRGGLTLRENVRLISPAEALQIADTRMYAEKDGRRGAGRHQARDVLLQILSEREPDLHEHMRGVGELALRVGRRMGMHGEALDEVVRGAELHDVGKMAVPDAILHKPAALDPDEWAFVHQHTIIGERILAAAPALRPVGLLVRSSHERWDGRGYPDGLAGATIPLGARIIAVCDAYDAMCTDRPYRRACTEAEALAELRRCGGTQFDPAVVEAFCAEILAASPKRVPQPA
jgi:HD domain-containing protein